MPHVLAQVVLPYFTLTPEDVAVNTFHFDADSSVLDAPDALSLAVARFYNVAEDEYSYGVGAYLSPVVSRGTKAASVRLYNMSEPKPRRPFETFGFTLPSPAGPTSGLPNEVACVASFQGAKVSGIPQARRRGRVFLGPLVANAVNMGTNSVMPTISSPFTEAIRTACLRLANESSEADAEWSVFSRVASTLTHVRSGWIDSDPDTQRRRENGVRTRTVWSRDV